MTGRNLSEDNISKARPYNVHIHVHICVYRRLLCDCTVSVCVCLCVEMTENADISRELFPNDREGKKQQRDGEEGGSEGKKQQRDGEEGGSEGKTQQRDGEEGGSEGKKQQRDGEEGGSEGKTQQRDGEEGGSEGKTQQRDGEEGGSEGKTQQRDGEEGGSEGKTQQRDGEEGGSEGKTQQRDGEEGGSEIDTEEPLRDLAMGLSAVGEEVSVSKEEEEEEEEEEGGREDVGENDLDSLKEAMAQLVVREREGEGKGEGVRRGENGKNRGEYQDTDDRVATTVSTQHSAKKIHDRENGCPVWSEQTSPRSNPATEPPTLHACNSMGAEAGPSVRGSGDDGAVGGGGEVTECDSATCQPETPSVGGGGVNLFLLG